MDLFNSKELSRSDKMKATRKLTNKLTAEAIDWLNSTGQFLVHRQNNIPSTRLAQEAKTMMGKVVATGDMVEVEVVIPVVYHKKGQKEFALLDIAGVTLPYQGRPGGIHCEIEVKYGSDTLKPDQKERIKSIQDAGGISFSISSMETLKLQVKKYMVEPGLAF